MEGAADGYAALDGHNIFRQFQPDGVWEQIRAELHMALRDGCGWEASPTAGIQDRDGAALVFDKIRQRFNWSGPLVATTRAR